MTRETRLKVLRQRHLTKLAERTPIEGELPKRFDTKPLNFDAFREHECLLPGCGNVIKGRKFCCKEHREMLQRIKAPAVKPPEKKGPGPGFYRKERCLNDLKGYIRALPQEFTAREASEVWGISKSSAGRRLERALDLDLISKTDSGRYQKHVKNLH